MNPQSRLRRRLARIEETAFLFLMRLALISVVMILGWILATLLIKGMPVLSWELISQPPQGGYYLGGKGGILNAILGSLYLAAGGTLLALIAALPVVFYLTTYLHQKTRRAALIRLALDVLWGIPSIVYGVFGFLIMLSLGLRASLLAGIITLAFLELPILIRGMDEFIRTTPEELVQSSLAVGATPLDTTLKVISRQTLPGLITAVLLAFGRGIGDAASVLFTAGYTDHLPTSLFEPAASLPLAVFFQLGTPFPAVQQRAYASALVLTIIILVISFISRWLISRFNKYLVR
ncbi:ABC-type phosphate transport system, permease component [Bellilinea caldifistulae]|nr:ABC transporter permease subunit [Bellilinea caldifistulae]GAP12120.1 ABC-type phosphate transport system, permease component [Bellilinea caldifistulae]